MISDKWCNRERERDGLRPGGESGFCQMGGRSGPAPSRAGQQPSRREPAPTENSSMRLRSQRRRRIRVIGCSQGMSRADSRRCGCNGGRHPTQLLPEQEFSGSGPNILEPGFPTIDHDWHKQQAHSASVVAARVEVVALLGTESKKSVVVRSLVVRWPGAGRVGKGVAGW